MKVDYLKSEGGIWEEIYVRQSVTQLTDRLNAVKLLGGRIRLKGVRYFFGLRRRPFHALRLPDGQVWDTVNGWR